MQEDFRSKKSKEQFEILLNYIGHSSKIETSKINYMCKLWERSTNVSCLLAQLFFFLPSFFPASNVSTLVSAFLCSSLGFPTSLGIDACFSDTNLSKSPFCLCDFLLSVDFFTKEHLLLERKQDIATFGHSWTTIIVRAYRQRRHFGCQISAFASLSCWFELWIWC